MPLYCHLLILIKYAQICCGQWNSQQKLLFTTRIHMAWLKSKVTRPAFVIFIFVVHPSMQYAVTTSARIIGNCGRVAAALAPAASPLPAPHFSHLLVRICFYANDYPSVCLLKRSLCEIIYCWFCLCVCVRCICLLW